MTRRPVSVVDTSPTPTSICRKDLDSSGLVFWGVVSGTFTLEEGMGIGACKGENMRRSMLSARLNSVLCRLVSDGVLDGRSPFVPFDADRRCLDCGVIHEDHPVLQRAGVGCFRRMWGGPPPLNTAGLRSGGRRR